MNANLEIRLMEKGQGPVFPEHVDAKPADLIGAAVVEKMTAGLRTAVTLYIKDENGNKFFVNTTARILVNGLAPAIRGFMERVGDDPNKA